MSHDRALWDLITWPTRFISPYTSKNGILFVKWIVLHCYTTNQLQTKLNYLIPTNQQNFYIGIHVLAFSLTTYRCTDIYLLTQNLFMWTICELWYLNEEAISWETHSMYISKCHSYTTKLMIAHEEQACIHGSWWVHPLFHFVDQGTFSRRVLNVKETYNIEILMPAV